MNSPDFSVITITHNRNKHLENLIRGLELSSMQPTELVIVYMNQIEPLHIRTLLPIREIHINSDGTLPLARARNVGANAALNEQLVFLDVDCIPSRTMCEHILTVAPDSKSLTMGTPRYITPGSVINEIDDTAMDAMSVEHKDRQHIPQGKTDAYTLFWSLCFAVTQSTFRKIGGFDENYTGYGGEDTDFALMAQKNDIPFYIASAHCYHQYHPVYKPPVQHIDDIVINSNYFYDKWQKWPMEGWLQKFADDDLLEWSPHRFTHISEPRKLNDIEIAKYKDTLSAY